MSAERLKSLVYYYTNQVSPHLIPDFLNVQADTNVVLRPKAIATLMYNVPLELVQVC